MFACSTQWFLGDNLIVFKCSLILNRSSFDRVYVDGKMIDKRGLLAEDHLVIFFIFS